MDMGSSMFSGVNMDLGRRYWYTVAGFVGAFMIIRGVNLYKAQQRWVDDGLFIVDLLGAVH